MADAKEAADVGDVKHAGLKRKLDLVLQYVKILFEGNPLLLHFTLLPIAFFACYLLGWFITWVTVLVLSISLMTQRISERKKEFYDRAALELAAKEQKDVETCEWLNTLVKKYCTTCMESHVLPVIKEQLQNNQVPLVTKMSVKKCNFGESFPRIESANTVRGLSSRNYQTDFMLTFNSDAYIEVKLVLVKGMKVIIRVDEVYISGNLRLKMHFNAEFPALSTASVCFVDDPVISFSVKAMNSGDLMSLLGPIEEMIMQAIQTPIREEMVFPQVLCWNFSGERQTADKPSGPIADIQVIFKKEKYVPPNYKVLSKSISGTGTGNVNSKIGDDIYLCYKPKKDSDAETLPVTGICVVQSHLDPKDRGFLRLFPPDFTPYITTASTTIANLNGGNSGVPTFLGFRRDNINPPITHIGLYNKTVNEHLPPNYSILFATPDGGKANLNAGVSKADEVYLVYQGGTPSSFGYLKAPVAPGERGTLQVTVISGEGLKIADITGSSDPFAVVYVGSPGSKAPSGSEKTRTIYKNLDPIWNDTFLLRAAPGDCLHIQMYDEDPGLRNDKLGIAVIPLDNLERGKPLERSYKLQKISRGRVKINVVALDFGLEPTETPYNKESFTQISVENKKNSSASNVFKEDHGDDDTSESVDITKMEYKFKDGFVEKLPTQRNILYSGWKRRWCVLRQESLCFSKHKDSNSEPKSISLIAAKLETNNETGQIIVRRDGKTLTMRVGGSEFDQWVSFLKNNILVATARNPLHYSSSSSGSISRDPKDESSEQAPISSSSNEPVLTRSASRALKRLKK